MADCVLDAAVVAMANGDLAGRRPGNSLDRRLVVLEDVVAGRRRVRFNSKLLVEYIAIVKEHRNDVIHVFFEVLDSPLAVNVGRNTLTRQQHSRAARDCRWPTHDQHLLAAAIDGDRTTIFVTEDRLAECAARILACFAIRVQQLV